MCQHTARRLARCLQQVIDLYKLCDGNLLGFVTGNVFSHYLMPWELQSTLQASGIEWPELGNHIPSMAHLIQLALDVFMRSLGV